MSDKQNLKCMVSFLWTNALVVGVLELLLFSFIDPADIASAMMLDVEPGVFRIKAYIFTYIFLWLMFNASTFLNCYFARLRHNKYLQDK
ncbi:MAG: hypothetical protein OQL09_00015 [Gammaproteobacteria bacterium]|nr:hypothetical protein [Gammaproteobacteria bacterium]